MYRITTLLRLSALAVFALFPLSMEAQSNGQGGAIISQFFIDQIYIFWPLAIVVTTLIFVIAGFTLMTSQDEGAIDATKKTMAAAMVSGIAATIIYVFGPANLIRSFYNPKGLLMPNTASILGNEAIGVADWLAAMAVMLGMLIIIIAVIKAVSSLGGDESAYTAVRTTVLHVILGLIIIGGAFLIQSAFFGSNTGPMAVVTADLGISPNPLLQLILEKMRILLSFILLVAVVILIYAGFKMIIGLGEEDQYSAAKSLLVRVIIGILVIGLSYTLIFAVESLFF